MSDSRTADSDPVSQDRIDTPPLETQDDRRRADRADLAVRVEYETVDALFSDFTRNVNEGGLFIETDQPAPLDSTIALHFCLPGSDVPIKASGRVVRLSVPPEPAGMAVMFEELDAEAREQINALVRELRSRPA